jgi:hypothetical protein
LKKAITKRELAEWLKCKECLSSKWDALSSNHKEKKKKKMVMDQPGEDKPEIPVFFPQRKKDCPRWG